MAEEKKEFLKKIEEDERLAEGDREILRATLTGEGLERISSGELLDMSKKAKERVNDFEQIILTKEQSEFVKNLRLNKNYTWRKIAEICYKEWNGNWYPPSNQLMGMVLCEKAADILNENKEDWD